MLHTRHVRFTCPRTFVDAAGVALLRRLYQDIPLIIWVKGRHWTCTEHRDNRKVHGNTDMHRPRIRSQKEHAAAKARGKPRQADLSRKDMDMTAVLFFHLRQAVSDGFFIARSAKEGDFIAIPDECICTFGKVIVNPALCHPTRTNVKGDDLCLPGKIFSP